jgi:adenosyl cobinamide kinase/adenosyl cobinamide phosphate guanylyltransferase
MIKLGKLIVYLGGVRSGKSRLAQERMKALVKGGSVAYLATAHEPALKADSELSERIAAHRLSRPKSWEVMEGWNSLVEPLKRLSKERVDGILLDGLGMFVAANMKLPRAQVLDEIEVFALSCRHQAAYTVITADEVGLGGIAGDAVSRKFADLNGQANQDLAARADEVWWVTAGLGTRIKSGHARQK